MNLANFFLSLKYVSKRFVVGCRNLEKSCSYFGILIEMEKGPPFTLNNQLTSADPYPVVKIDLKPKSTGISISVKKSVIRTRYG